MFPTLHDLRASEAEREQTVAFLKDHCAQGRLSLDELSARVDGAYRARGLLELEALTDDLPGSPFAPVAPSPGAVARRGVGRALGVGLLALAVVALAAAVPADVWAPLLVLALPLVAMLLFTVLPFALPVLALAWMLSVLARGSGHEPLLPPSRHPSSRELRRGARW